MRKPVALITGASGEIGHGLIARLFEGARPVVTLGLKALDLAKAPQEKLTRPVYNIGGFNPSAEEIRAIVLRHLPGAQITTQPDVRRQGIVDSWPADVDDSAARRDWGYAQKYDLERAFSDYLVPKIRGRYR